jgi:hypothetical protein
MSNDSLSDGSSARKSILVVNLGQHLTGVPVEKVIQAEWEKEKAHNISSFFDNNGFNLDPRDVPSTLKALRHKLEERSWDGLLLGWCVRGHVEFTLLFEELVTLCCEVQKSAPQMKIMFPTGPDNLVETVARNFPVGKDI